MSLKINPLIMGLVISHFASETVIRAKVAQITQKALVKLCA